MTNSPPDRLVLFYLGDTHYHRGDPEDGLRPACRPERIRGVTAMRVRAERDGLAPCPLCWPELDPGAPAGEAGE